MSPQIQTLPRLLVELDGAALSVEEMRTLWAVRVQQRLSLPTVCELTFIDPEVLLSKPETIAPGAKISVRVPDTDEPLFSGEVTATEHLYEPGHGREVRVRGYDALHRLRKRQPVRAHVELTLVDLIKELVADLGLNVEAEAPGPLWQRLVQFRQSDFQMITEVAERCGLYLTLRDKTLHVITLAGLDEEITLKLGETLLEARIEVNGDGACRSVATTGWDPLRVEQHEGKADQARNGRDISASVDPSDVGGSGERTIIDETIGNDLQADAIAQAELDSRMAREVILHGVAEGDPKLRPGARVQIENVAPPLAGRYVLTSVDHTFDSVRGFVSTISTAPPPPGVQTRGPIAALGIVTHVDDPDGFGRVRVRLPTYRDIETDWMGVVTPGAGLGKGLLALPDVADTVLVLLPSGDPANGVVLGGLYGMWTRDEWDWGVEQSAVKRYTLRTPGGQRLRLDDARETIRLENSDGSYLEMSPDKVLLHAQRDLRIEAPGRNVVIKANKVDFQQG
jgi:phage baseplate assembly protein gpV/phage protein D